ncbi:LuxR C-terminal-related transcriptional regulator [Paenibacillus septentrionalis]|uniref:LuxR C-terminal-related transcriptional regulator n=1 Tax=Paenibacillus septentrionalis TaxID=429342 RepID=A0ABW1V6L5_9BACL
MALVFELEKEKVMQPWKTLDSLDNKLLQGWDKQRQASQAYYKQSCMKERITKSQYQHYYKGNECLIKIASKHCEETVSDMLKSVLFIITTLDGIVLAVLGKQELVTSLDQNYNLGKGSVFTIENAGLNAITLSTEVEDWVYLSGAEHDFQLFKKWNCFCSPIRQHGEIVGYLDMSFAVGDDHLLTAALFTSTLKSIESELDKPDQQQRIFEQFHAYRLSPREKEIACMWLNNCSALRIASELGITEGTVRNVIKKIYRKTEVCDKGQFMRKFIS